MRTEHLCLVGVLGGGVNLQTVVLRGNHEGAVRLKIEVLLPAHIHLALHNEVRLARARIDVAADDLQWVGEEGLGGDGVLDADHCGHVFVLDLHQAGRSHSLLV
jgi:hypothetical protein